MERNLFKQKKANPPPTSTPMNPPPIHPSKANSSRPTSFPSKHHPSSSSDHGVSTQDEAFKPEFDYTKHGLEQHDVSLEGSGVFRMYTMNHLQDMKEEPQNTTNLPILSATVKTRKSESVLVFIHGAGLSSLSWCLCMQNLRQLVLRSSSSNSANINFMRSPPTPIETSSGSLDAFGVDDYEYCAIDLRGHGASHTVQDSALSIDTLVDDVIALLQQVYRGKKRSFIIIGHSLGGSIAVRCAHKLDSIEETERRSGIVQPHEIMTVKGVIVI